MFLNVQSVVFIPAATSSSLFLVRCAAVLGLGEWWLVLCFWKLEHIAVSALCFLAAVLRVIDSVFVYI